MKSGKGLGAEKTLTYDYFLFFARLTRTPFELPLDHDDTFCKGLSRFILTLI